LFGIGLATSSSTNPKTNLWSLVIWSAAVLLWLIYMLALVEAGATLGILGI
jgi:hypothetical protein